MSASRSSRKEAIRELVRTHNIRTQGELVSLLKEQGFAVTQATVSRDIADLDLRKGDGVYVLSEELALRTLGRKQVRDVRRAGNQVVVITGPGAAQATAAALDAANLEGVLGTIAGDDTILVIAADEDSAVRFQADLTQLIQ